MEPLHFEEILGLLDGVDGWEEFNQEFICKSFYFPDFVEALEFVNRIGVVAEAQNHHPKLVLSYGKVLVELSTHDVQGLSLKDFELAKLIDELFEEEKPPQTPKNK